MKSFFHGAGLALKGVVFFYRERSLWKHAIGPWSLLAGVYGLIIWLILHLTNKLAAFLNTQLADSPEFLRLLLSGSLTFIALLISSVLVLTTLSTFFEIFGSLFFDRMLEDVNERYYNIPPEKVPLKKQLLLICQGAGYGVKTTLLFLFLVIISLFLPFAGQLLLITLIGIRMGYSFIFAPGFLKGETITETTSNFRSRRLEVAGFGICAYLLQLLPFSMPITLPGIMIGALMLYNDKEPEKR